MTERTERNRSSETSDFDSILTALIESLLKEAQDKVRLEVDNYILARLSNPALPVPDLND